MRKLAFATILGGILGIFDGMTAWFTPEVRDQIVGIIIGSTIKGIVTGVLIGVFAQRVHSLLMLPGSLVGLIVGYAAQKHQNPDGAAPRVSQRTSPL